MDVKWSNLERNVAHLIVKLLPASGGVMVVCGTVSDFPYICTMSEDM